MPAPTAASAEYVVSYRRCSHRPAPRTIAEATPPNATLIPGPIQPRLTASTKKKTTPRSVTTPPAKASAFAPIRSAVDIVRPQSKPRPPAGCAGCAGRAVAAAAGAGSRAGCCGCCATGEGVGAGAGGEEGEAARAGAVARPARRSSTIAWRSATCRSSKSTRLRSVWGADADRAAVVGADGPAGRLEAALLRT